ncbi:hypothetical protein ACLSY8_09950 [Avibacterium avium]|uniref:Outer membrane protein n=3 Tax=Avibacterium TaxID=292486 RepID=A0A379AXN7_AVIGA|nr:MULTISPECIES: hypothetical protein [Avibacterium]POY43732.1 hypothetical protein C3007_08955 [Avibacterium gallinarum]TDP27290.1 hypothetical protein EV689_11530 [Avibacterium gallinarum]SUB27066.1 Uncharacterised protein [Avibacterium gallinarum]VGM95752.1 Uncharacterised protein [uncultured Avibacterium sp.]
MKLFKVLLLSLFALPNAWANLDTNIKYSSNYLMPAYVHFNANGSQYRVDAKINIPLYNIEFKSVGTQSKTDFKMTNYQDVRNGKPYAKTIIKGNEIAYGKVKNGLKSEPLEMPTFDLFTVAFQLSYYDKLPQNFQITNGKKLYPMKNVLVKKSERKVTRDNQSHTEITYQFRTGEKSFVVKKYAGEQFPRYISYDKDGDHYELTFSEFVK